MRVTTLCRRLLDLDRITVTNVNFEGEVAVAEVRLRRRRLACLRCSFTTRTRYDTRTVASRWRGLDLGRRKVTVRARLRRLGCPSHGVLTEAVPFARTAARFTADFEDLVAYLATKTDNTTITGLLRIDWDTVGRICERVVADGLDPARLDGLANIGVAEVTHPCALQCCDQPISFGSLEVPLPVPALDRLAQQVRRGTVGDALGDGCRRSDRRDLLPPTDLLRCQILVVHDVIVSIRPAKAALPGDSEMDAVGIHVASTVGVERGLV